MLPQGSEASFQVVRDTLAFLSSGLPKQTGQIGRYTTTPVEEEMGIFSTVKTRLLQ